MYVIEFDKAVIIRWSCDGRLTVYMKFTPQLHAAEQEIFMRGKFRDFGGQAISRQENFLTWYGYGVVP